MKTLTVSNLHKSYNDKNVLNGLNFEVIKRRSHIHYWLQWRGQINFNKMHPLLTKPDSGSVDDI